MYQKIIESEYGEGTMNFHIAKRDDTVHVELTYPPWTDADNSHDQCRHVFVNQESVRASDGIRVHYDYDRDGFVIEQPEPYEVKGKPTSHGTPVYEIREKWIEVAFCRSWAFDNLRAP